MNREQTNSTWSMVDEGGGGSAANRPPINSHSSHLSIRSFQLFQFLIPRAFLFAHSNYSKSLASVLPFVTTCVHSVLRFFWGGIEQAAAVGFQIGRIRGPGRGAGWRKPLQKTRGKERTKWCLGKKMFGTGDGMRLKFLGCGVTQNSNVIQKHTIYTETQPLGNFRI